MKLQGVNIDIIRKFTKYSKGDWRNAVFVECKVCKYEKEECSGNLLFVTDPDGVPILLPENIVSELSGEIIDKSECLFEMSNAVFEQFYSNLIVNKCDNPEFCPLKTLINPQ